MLLFHGLQFPIECCFLTGCSLVEGLLVMSRPPDFGSEGGGQACVSLITGGGDPDPTGNCIGSKGGSKRPN